MRLHTHSLDITICQDFKSRLIGLYLSQPIGARQAVLLSKCNCVHTFGMREPLSLVFLDKHFSIVREQINASPRRVYGCFKAHHIIEMARKTNEAFDQIRSEIMLLRQDPFVVEHLDKRRIKTSV